MTSAYDSIDRSLLLLLGRVSRDESISYLPEDEPESPSIIRHVSVERKNVLQRVTFGELVDAITSHVERITEFCNAKRRRVSSNNDIDISLSEQAPTEDDVNNDVFEIGRLSSLRLLLPEKINNVNEFSPAALLGHLGAITPLVDLVNIFSNPSTFQLISALYTFLQYSLDSLWNLSAFSENKELLVRQDIVPALVVFSARFDLQRCEIVDPSDRKRRRAVATILHNISETRFRNGERNQVQRRILEEGGGELIVDLFKASLACREVETSIICALTVSHLMSHLISCPGSILDFPIINDGLEFVKERVIKKGLHVNGEGQDVYQGWLSLIPFVALVENSESQSQSESVNENLLYIRLFALESICVFLKNDTERSARKLIRDIAMLSGISTFRRIAIVPQHVSTAIKNGTGDETINILYKCSKLALSIIDALKAAPMTQELCSLEPDTLHSDLSKLFIQGDATTKPSTSETTSINSDSHSDTTLQCIDNGVVVAKFRIHRAIIAARVPSLAPLLSTSRAWGNSSSPTVDIHSASPKGIEALLQWCYSSNPHLTSDNAVEALEVADFYCCNGLKNLCELFLCQGVNQNTAAHILDIALRFNAPQLATFCKNAERSKIVQVQRESLAANEAQESVVNERQDQ